MAENVLGTLFGDIADAIRSKTGGTETMKPAEFPEQISNIESSNVIEHIEIALDFSNGNMTETLPEGYSVSSATILKPDTLIAENIAEGVTIAGIVGTHKGGGGELDGTEAYVSYGYDDSGNVISASFHKCTTVPQYAFYNNSTLQSVDFSDSPNLTSIGTYAFNGCTNLTSISIPNGVTSIGNNAFYQCSGLKRITLLSNITSIPQAAFSKCSNLESITLPNTVTSIGAQAFYECRELTSITIPTSVKSIANEAFRNCYKLAEVINKSSLTFAVGATSNGYAAYYAIEVHSGESKIVNVNDYLFYTYNGNNYLLSYVGADKELTLPDYNGENYEIRGYAFYHKTIMLTGATLPNTVTSIGDYAFQSTNIANITIPASVISIGVEAFKLTNKLTSVTFADTSGWYVTKTKGATSGTNLTSANLSNTSTAVDYLTSTYVMYYWYNK